ncbi:MAG: VanZ family protein [Saprospiraceae bacterium]|nr:VanZ family protein [Saprospiraceae bacterium]
MPRLFSAKLNLFLFSLLLIFTPFLLLQNYLQDAVGLFSHLSFNVGAIEIPFVLSTFIVFIVLLIIKFRKSYSRKKVFIWLVILLMWFLGQQSTDYFLNISFYDLQHNWHYFAYGIFAVLAYRVFLNRNFSKSKIIYSIYLRALLISTFDEAIQILLSSRVFDISDIAKDLWGVLMGIIVVIFIFNNAEISKKEMKIREKKIKDYFKNPFGLLVLLIVFTYILLFISSLLTEAKYGFNIIFITLIIFLIVFFVIHKTQTKTGKIAFSIIFGILFLLQIFSFTKNINKNITLNKTGLTVYKGIPIPYFDILIFENGGFRLVDKKIDYNQMDIKFMFTKASNILVIGCGESKKGRMGFPEDLESQFIYNTTKKRALQVIILPTAEACKVYNRLKQENKKVVFLIHNTK